MKARHMVFVNIDIILLLCLEFKLLLWTQWKIFLFHNGALLFVKPWSLLTLVMTYNFFAR